MDNFRIIHIGAGLHAERIAIARRVGKMVLEITG